MIWHHRTILFVEGLLLLADLGIQTYASLSSLISRLFHCLLGICLGSRDAPRDDGITAVIQRLTPQNQAFLHQHCRVCLSPGLRSQSLTLLIVSQCKTPFVHEHQADFQDLAWTFLHQRGINRILLIEPDRIFQVRHDVIANDWQGFSALWLEGS